MIDLLPGARSSTYSRTVFGEGVKEGVGCGHAVKLELNAYAVDFNPKIV